MSKGSKVIILIIGFILSGITAIAIDALFNAGDMAMDILCKNNEKTISNIDWREISDTNCRIYFQFSELIRKII